MTMEELLLTRRSRVGREELFVGWGGIGAESVRGACLPVPGPIN